MYNEIIKKVVEVFAPTPVYLVGGSVRDIILKRKQHDYDFCIKLTPEDMEIYLKGKYKTYKMGKRFGTIAFKIDGEMVEVTTFRSEEYEPGNRKPEVKYVNSLNEDLYRRDFTINSMAQKYNSKIIDPYNGQDDLKNRIIRTPMSPKKAFTNDPLRMLRACRFASQLGFEIEEKTFKQIIKMSHHILDISKERWVQEMDKLLQGDYVVKGLNYLMKSKLLNYMIPELSLQYNYGQNSKYHNKDLWDHTFSVVEATPKENIILRWAALLHDVAKIFVRTENKKGHSNYIKHEILGAEIASKYADYLNFSKERKTKIIHLIKHHLEDDCPLRQYDNMGKK